MPNALIHDATGAVLAWGYSAFLPDAGQSVVIVTDPATYPTGGVPSLYVKVVSGLFAAMTPAEIAAVNLAIPQRRPQRVAHDPEVTAVTNQMDPGGGWVDVIGLTTAEPLLPGTYQIVCGFELAMVASSAVHTGQCRLQVEGIEVATWQNPRSAYNRCQYVETFVFELGETPSFRLQLRRFGGGVGVARARKASIVIYPSEPISAELV
jgi:hypothetical protein